MIKEEGSRKNIFLSPYSIQQALLMTANGAAGDSRKELLSTLHLSQADMAIPSTGYQNLLIVLLKRCLTVNFHQLIRYGPKGS